MTLALHASIPVAEIEDLLRGCPACGHTEVHCPSSGCNHWTQETGWCDCELAAEDPALPFGMDEPPGGLELLRERLIEAGRNPGPITSFVSAPRATCVACLNEASLNDGRAPLFCRDCVPPRIEPAGASK